MSAPSVTGACATAGCPELGIEKDLTGVPPGYLPVMCGACGQPLPGYAAPEPGPPPEIDNTLPELQPGIDNELPEPEGAPK